MAHIDSLLRIMVEKKASDLHLTTSFSPFLRVHGEMECLKDQPVLTPASARELLAEIMPEDNRKELESTWDTDFAYEVDGVGRFRVNAFHDRHGLGGVLRVIPTKIPSADDLNLPKAVRDFCYLSKGLVVVTGPTGSGKSTTLAAMIDLINKKRSAHIITIEDPIEFVHTSAKCLVNQRQVHRDTQSFARALRAALREDPDIVLVGEMRDLETIEIAIETAETGHLVFGTLHTNTAYSTVDRIIDKFPADRQNQIRSMLADSLKGVVAQTLCRKIGGGRVAALEILVVTTAVSSNIRDGKTHMIPSAMQIGRGVGMQLFGDAYTRLVVEGLVTPEEAFVKAVDKDDLLKRLGQNNIKVNTDNLDAPAPQSEAERDAMYQQLIQESIVALQKNPNDLDALNTIAWILSTSSNAKLRNAVEAVKAAERAYAITRGEHPAILDTLGAAYAESGNFEKALGAARKGLQLAQKAGEAQLVEALQQRIKLYESRKPVRD
jgi:twitching motility protein PilT